MLVSIVVPCYNSERSIEQLVELTIEEFKKIDGYECEFILVNDYSKDDTFSAIRRLTDKYSFVKGINFAKNFGQHNAVLAGLHYVSGDFVIGMDDDLQHHPNQIPLFIEKMEEGYDVVFGIYKQRKFSFIKNVYEKISHYLMWKILERPAGIEMSSFWMARRYVTDKMTEFDGYNGFLQLLFFRTTHNMANIEIEHHERAYGKSNYSFIKGLSLFISSINYTVIPLRIATFLGVIFSIAGFIGAIIVLIQKILNPIVAIGWSSLMCAMLVLFGISFLMLGIIGEYIGKLILNINKTPQFVVREAINVDLNKSTVKEGDKSEN